jgi:uncharacterized protein (DUF1778 family)
MAKQTERLDMRLSPEHKKLNARTVISQKDCEAFLELVDSDDEPAVSLTNAVERYQANRVDR